MFDPPQGHADPVRDIEQHAEADGRPGDHLDAAQQVAGIFMQQIAGEDGRDRGDDHVPDHALACGALAAQCQRRPAQHLPEIAPEIQHHRQQRADMHRHVEQQPLILPAGDIGHQDQMRRGADREKFGNALDQGQDDQVEQRQVSTMHARVRGAAVARAHRRLTV